MSELNTEELELATLLGRVMSAPLAPLREHGAKLEKGLSNAASESTKSSLLISSSLDSISQSQKKLMSVLVELKELPEQLQQLASRLESMREAAVTVEQMEQMQRLLERHAREQHSLTEHGLKNAQEAFFQQQQSLVALNAQINLANDQQSLLLQEQFERADAHLSQVLKERTQALEEKQIACVLRIQLIGSHLVKLQNTSLTADQVTRLLEVQARTQQELNKQEHEQVQASLRQNLQGVTELQSRFKQATTDVSAQLQEQLAHVELNLGLQLQSLTQRHGQQFGRTFKWMVALGVLNLVGLVACMVWVVLHH
jgi:tetrahydromethanopterin S-methyltransferase subunit G